uniref:sarcospan n=1 Tax=Myxine glutinosa TaxID=7769 RepID=UPI00358DE2D7
MAVGRDPPGQEGGSAAPAAGSNRVAQSDDSGGKTLETKPVPEHDERYTCCGCPFPLLLALLQLVLGAGVTAVAFTSLYLSNLPVRDTPYWAGLPICFVACVGFFILCVSYKAEEDSSVQFCAKITYFIFCFLAMVLALAAVAYCGYHYTLLTELQCEDGHHPDGICRCRLDPNDPIARTFHYPGEDCDQATDSPQALLLLQVALNILIALLSLLACFIMWKHRYQVFFAGVKKILV